MKKFPLAVKLNSALPSDFLKQQLILWGVEQTAVPDRQAEVLTAVQNFLEARRIPSNKLKVYTFAAGNALYLLHAQPEVKFCKSNWADLEVKGLGAYRNTLGDDPNLWDPFVFTDPASISDPIARLQAENISNPAKFESILKFSVKANMDLAQITPSSGKDDDIDAILADGNRFQAASATQPEPAQPQAAPVNPGISVDYDETKTERIDGENVMNAVTSKRTEVKVNMTNTSESTAFKDIKIQRFDPERIEVTTWVGNQVYELELSGMKNEQKIIAKLLSGLPDELRYAVRTDLQSEYPKVNGAYGGTIADFTDILKKHSMQTLEDMQEALQQLKLGNGKDLRKFFYQIKGLVDATLTDEQRATGVSDMLTTAKFREKLPAHLRNNQIIASSTKSGLALVGLAQRVLNRCKTDGVNANNFTTDKKKKPFKGKGGFKKGGGKKNDKGSKDDKYCDFCGLKGHILADCYKYNEAKRARREEVAQKKKKND